MNNLFIVFEGIDGSGTSTQANLLQNYFLSHYVKSVQTCEPSNGPVGQLIRQAMKKRVSFTSDRQLFDEQMAYLFAADRHDHLYNDVDGVLKLLKINTVISTRYYFSSYAYHCDTEEEFEFISMLNKKFPKPDLVIYIDNPIEISLERIQSRTSIDEYENMEKLIKVRKNYERIFADYKEKLLIVNGSKDITFIHNEVTEFIKEEFRCLNLK